MKAVVFRGIESVEVADAPEPRVLEPGDALVAVRLTAVCGSDLHVYRGRERGLDPGTVMGHEMVGEVIEVGSDVRRFRPGDRIAAPFTTSCGACFYCEAGLTCRCERGQLFGWVSAGSGLAGTQAERVRVPLADTTLLALPADVPAEAGLLLGDALSTGFFAADLAGVRPGGVAVVLGCGPVGLMAVVAACERRADRVLAVDGVAERLDLATSFGAVPINLGRERPLDVVRSATEGRGADFVIEAVGAPEATRLAFDLARFGGTVGAVGVHTEPQLAFSPGEAYDKNLTYRAGRCPARRYMHELMPLARRRASELVRVFSHRLPLDDGPRAYALFDERRDGCTKVLLEP